MNKNHKYITKTNLLKRDGWNLEKLYYWFPVPDETRRNFHIPSSKIDDPCCIKLYDRKKVELIESGGFLENKGELAEVREFQAVRDLTITYCQDLLNLLADPRAEDEEED